MKNLRKKRGVFSLSFAGFYLVSALVLTIPGMGIESIRFINSVKTQIKRVMPKDKYVLDPSSPLYENVMHNIVKKSFRADALSTLDYANQAEYNELAPKYNEFTDAWFEKYWQPKIDEHQAIDFYDIGLNMIEFDKTIAKTYQSYGYVNTGTQWIFHKNGINEIFSKDLANNAQRQQSIIDQAEYDNLMQASKPGLTGIDIKSSPGSLIVNNKVWFLNQQIDSIKYAISIQWLENPFMNKNLKATDVADYVTIDDLYHPKFSMGQQLAQAAFIILCTSIVITPISFTYGTIELKKHKKEQK